MRIVVLGSGGRVGSSLVPHLISRGHDVRYEFVDPATGKRVDLTGTAAAFAVLDKHDPDMIVNLAALTDVNAMVSPALQTGW
jgi:dTDP-4-dehydrorhamnose reductase